MGNINLTYRKKTCNVFTLENTSLDDFCKHLEELFEVQIDLRYSPRCSHCNLKLTPLNSVYFCEVNEKFCNNCFTMEVINE